MRETLRNCFRSHVSRCCIAGISADFYMYPRKPFRISGTVISSRLMPFPTPKQQCQNSEEKVCYSNARITKATSGKRACAHLRN